MRELLRAGPPRQAPMIVRHRALASAAAATALDPSVTAAALPKRATHALRSLKCHVVLVCPRYIAPHRISPERSVPTVGGKATRESASRHFPSLSRNNCSRSCSSVAKAQRSRASRLAVNMSAGAGGADPDRSTTSVTQPSCGGAEAEGVEEAERGGRRAGDGVVGGDEETRRRLMQSELLFDVGDDKRPLVYCDDYNMRLFGIEKLHPFDSGKWGRIVSFLIEEGRIQPHQVVHPRAATNDDLLLVHSQEYLDSLRSSFNLATIGELPPLALFPNFILQHRVVRPFRYQVGGSVLAAKLAVERGAAVNVGGGLHHCSRHTGMGFCALADISAIITFARAFLGVKRVLIVDLDAHQGNGHETDWMGDADVFIVDVYNAAIFPRDHQAKEAIRIAKELRSGTGTTQYLDAVTQALQEVAAAAFHADLLIYNAGTDILANDPLGRLAVTAEGVQRRDEMVFQFARSHSTPILMLTSGGYQPNNARIVADSLANLSAKQLLPLQGPPAAS